tara:strand:- start:1601 stop:2479 length:879 start_codon:yes stop_codon:yes gene_type:complete
MKILVTGGAGFVGSSLCNYLYNTGRVEVYSLDNYFTGNKKNHIDGVIYLEGDCKDIEKHVQFKPDMIYHLGEYSRVEQSFDDISKVWEYNKNGIFKVLEFCKKCGSKLIYAGSSTKFGDGGLGRSQSPYAWTKASNTELVKNYGTWFNLPYAIVYFYNVYGYREISQGKYATLIALFTQKMRDNLPLTVVSPGNQKRNFTHIEDIISGLVLVGENGFGDQFGIGSEESYDILGIANMFGGEIKMLPKRPGNRLSAEVHTEKVKALGWKCKNNIKDYINNLKANNWGRDLNEN